MDINVVSDWFWAIFQDVSGLVTVVTKVFRFLAVTRPVADAATFKTHL